MRTMLHRQTQAPYGGFGLPVCGLIPSPYYRYETGRDIHYLLALMPTYKVFVIGLQPSGTKIAVNFYLEDSSGTSTVCLNTLLSGTGNNDSVADILALINPAIDAYVFANVGAHPNSIEWLMSPTLGIRTESVITLSVQTSTGAVGTQVSVSQDALVFVDLSASTTASIAGNATLDLVVEVAPTNSATAGDWVVKGRSGNSQALSLAITLQSVQGVKSQAAVYVPMGYYIKVRSTSATGTNSGSVVEAYKLLL